MVVHSLRVVGQSEIGIGVSACWSFVLWMKLIYSPLAEHECMSADLTAGRWSQACLSFLCWAVVSTSTFDTVTGIFIEFTLGTD